MMSSDPRLSSLSPGSIVAGHRIEEVIARGGMGVVYRVTHLALERERALKVIAPELAADESFRTRFRREWKVAASFDHPHAIAIYDAGEAGELLYIAMQYVQGTDLRRMTADGPLDAAVVARIVDQVAGALDAAHARGLIHRDIKPANILVATRDGQPHAYLTDFGLTKHLGATVQLTDQGRWVGTVDYVAPEQIEGRPVDARTDIYGLGCVAYTALTGEVPFPRDSDIAKIWAHLSEPPPGVVDHTPGVPEALDDVVRRAMAKDPDDRFQSAGELGGAMLAAAGGAAPSATPTRPAPRRPIRRRRGRESIRVASVSVMLSIFLAIAILAVALVDGGDDAPVVARNPLHAFQADVGQVCDQINRDNAGSPRRAAQYRRRLNRAQNLQGLRDAVVDGTAHNIRVSNNLIADLGGLSAPTKRLTRTQRETVSSWRRNLYAQQDYRDRLKRVRNYEDLDQVVRRFDSQQRTHIERRSGRTMQGLESLGGPECDLKIAPDIRASPLPRNPEAQGGQGSNGSDSPRSNTAPDTGTSAQPVPDSSPAQEPLPAPDTSPAPEAAPPSPDATPPPAYAAPPEPVTTDEQGAPEP